MIVAAGDIFPIPRECDTLRCLRDALHFEELQASHPDHELFIVVSKKDPENHFAFVMRVAKAAVRIGEDWAEPWPAQLIDWNARIVTILPPALGYPLGGIDSTNPESAERRAA